MAGLENPPFFGKFIGDFPIKYGWEILDMDLKSPGKSPGKSPVYPLKLPFLGDVRLLLDKFLLLI